MKFLKRKKKKGEMSTQQIVMMIVLITSLVVILFFLVRLNLGGDSQNQLCHNSVLTKASALNPEAISLQCYTSDVCITEDGSCEDFLDSEEIKVNSLDEVYGVLANEMADCWWMLGQGNINYVGKAYFFRENYCSICSQIYFDNSLEDIEGIEDKKISKDGLYDYLAENEISEDETYLQYIFGTNDLNRIKEVGTFGEIEIGKQYFNVMGITDEIGWGGYVIGGTVVIAGFFVGYTWVGLGIAAITITASEVGELIEPEIGALVIEGESGNQFMAPTITEADSNKFKALNCKELLAFT